jgi:hypothetical protein
LCRRTGDVRGGTTITPPVLEAGLLKDSSTMQEQPGALRKLGVDDRTKDRQRVMTI